MKKTILYFLNGKPVDKKAVTERKGKLSRVVEEKHFTAPLTKEEEEQERVKATNASNYFNRMREDREDLEARHG
jgi:hypothetical protein